jgi:nucleotide-binding universal stress UspA family protein
MFSHVLIPVDGSVHAQAAIDCGSEIADKFDAKLTLLHVVTEPEAARLPDWMREYERVESVHLTENEVLKSIGGKILSRAVDSAERKRANKVEAVTEAGDPARVIRDYADNNDVDLIVMGRRGLGDAAGLLLGSVSHKVAQLSNCACMTVV